MIISTVLSDGSSISSALCRRLASGTDRDGNGHPSDVRSSPVLDSWDELTDVCRGADVVYLLSALDLPDAPSEADLQEFRTGVCRVLECCQECDVGSLVFLSSSSVVSSNNGLHSSGEKVPFVTREEDKKAHAIASAEAEVLNASETNNLGGSSCLYTCALRPAAIYGTDDDRVLQRALSWVGWGLNRLALRSKDVQSDMVYKDNLVEAHVLAGNKLMDGAANARAGGAGWSTSAPVCSGQAYFVSDGQPCNLQEFMDDVLEGLDFSTSKIVRVPTAVALAIAGMTEVLCKTGLKGEPVWTRAEVRHLTQDRTLDISRIRKDLEYEPIVDPDTALRSTVDELKGAGWGRHTFLVPGLGYWIGVPIGIYLVTIAAFESTCPTSLPWLRRFASFLVLGAFRKLFVARLVVALTVGAHAFEGWYAYRLAHRAGHADTAPRWLIQTFILGFPSFRLLKQLLS